MTWIQTYSRTFDLLNPRASDVCLEDIAYSLAGQARFTGHTRARITGRPGFGKPAPRYTVAQHAWLVAEYVARELGRPDLGFNALHHDSAEAYTGDISAPMKAAIRSELHGWADPIKEIEARIEMAVAEALGLPRITAEDRALIKHADLVLLATEKRDLFPGADREWTTTEGNACRTPLPAPWAKEIAPFDAWMCEETFLRRHETHARYARKGAA